MRLFKYVNPDRIDVLRAKLIRFTQPTACNDPFEFRPIVQGLQDPQATQVTFAEEFDRLLNEKLDAASPEVRVLFDLLKDNIQLLPQLRKQFVDQGVAMFEAGSRRIKDMMVGGLGNHVGILSLTEDPVSTPMWAHYANNHSGFLIELDSSHAWFSQRAGDNDEFRHIRKVTYISQPKSPYLRELDGNDIFYTKNIDWAYEKEWRLIRPLQDSDHKILDEIYLFSLPSEIMKSVVIGLRTAPSTKEAIHNILTGDPSLNHVTVGQVRECSTSQKLVLDV
jgi:hypothetical protein